MKNTLIFFLTNKAINLSRNSKKIIVIILDIIICLIATWIALSLRLGELIDLNIDYAIPSLISIFLAIPLFFSWGIYKVIFRYLNNDSILVIIKAITAYSIIFSVILVFFSIKNVPRSIGLMQPMIMFFLLLSSRWIIKLLLNFHFSMRTLRKDNKEVIIYGAGESGRQLALNLVNNNEFKLLFFVDDNKSFWGGTINGYNVKSPSYLSNLNKPEKPRELWLAMPRMSTSQRKKLISDLQSLRLHVRTLPSFSDLASRKVNLSDLRELDINELIGREAVKPDTKLFKKCVFQKTVLVTGAGGSIGSEICRQILTNNPKHLLLAENSEVALYNIHSELTSLIKNNSTGSDVPILVPLLIDIKDKKRLNHIFETWRPFTVYHAAAFKHVPIVEQNVVAGVSNNVFGTLNCANVAMRYKVKHFVLVSTDKAVRPTNIMGASKRLAEMTLQILANDATNKFTSFCMVRFGNVLGSSGSVVPLFRKQIQSGGPITLTHENVTRYFMTVTEAAQLVIQAGAMSNGGEVFVLDMGKSVRIFDIARNMIETAGLQVKDDQKPWGDIEIQITGLRPGEKLYEELLISNNPKETMHHRILKANELFIVKKDFDDMIQKLSEFLDNNDISNIIKLLQDNVSGYIPNKEVDLISSHKKNVLKKQFL